MDENFDTPESHGIDELLRKCEADLQSSDIEVRRKAAEALYNYSYENPSCATAVPLLTQLICDPDDKIGEHAAWGLKYCAPHSIEPLIMCLMSTDELVRYRSCDALGNIGDKAAAACDPLRALLRDAVPKVRSKSAWALGLLHDTQQRTIDALFQLLNSEFSSDRSSALHALGNLGKALADPLPLQLKQNEILGFLHAPNEEERRWACYVIESLGIPDADFAKLLVELLIHDDADEVRRSAASSLKELASRFDLLPYVDALGSALGRRGGTVTYLCETLGTLGIRAKGAIPALMPLLNDENGYLAIAAAEALWNIDQRVEEILPALERLFPDYGESVCDAIYLLGAAAAPLAPKVIEALQAEDWDLQWAAADALGAIASADPATITLLIETLNHDSPIVKSAAVRALVKTGTPAIEPMRRVLRNHQDSRCEWIADTLGRMGLVAQGATSDLHEALQSQNHALQGWAAVALGAISGARAVVPRLMKCLEQVDTEYLRVRAAEALGTIGPPAAHALPLLEAAREDDDFDLREAAETAIGKIRAIAH